MELRLDLRTVVLVFVTSQAMACGCTGKDQETPAPDGGGACADGAICIDSGVADGATDADAMADAEPDADAAPAACAVGTACNAARGCARGECIAEGANTLGATGDPIVGHPDGATTVPTTSWRDGYCTPVLPSPASGFACDADLEADPTCGDCGTCVELGGTQSLCFQSCAPSVDGRDVCRAGYECNLTAEVCFPGCTVDDECRISRRETNGIPGIQDVDDCVGDSTRPTDEQVCGGVDTGFDALTYDSASTATCDAATGRCRHAGSAGASGGDACVSDEACEADGVCLDAAGFDWPGGACTKFRCDLPGNECAGDAVCQERRLGVFLCLDGCTVAEGLDGADEATWLTNRGGCREGYGCIWNGVDGAGVAGGGACVPGEYNDVSARNIGGACDDDSDCWSPFGQGLCLSANDDGGGFRDGYCTVLDCLAPGMPANLCGATGECVDLDGADGDITGCLAGCAGPEDCRPRYACSDLDGDSSTEGGVCVPGCGTDEECRASEHCEVPAGETSGDCTPD